MRSVQKGGSYQQEYHQFPPLHARPKGGDGSKNTLVLGASRSAQSKPTELQDALQVCEPHLDLLALTA
jgi:hypothetical protein